MHSLHLHKDLTQSQKPETVHHTKNTYFYLHSTWQDIQWQTYSAEHSARINHGSPPHLRSENLPGVRPTNSSQSTTRYSVSGSSSLTHFLFWSGHPNVLSVSFHSTVVLSIVALTKNNKTVQPAHNSPFP